MNPFQLILQANASSWEYYTKRRQVVKGESGGIVADTEKADKGRGFAGDVFGKREQLVEGGLDVQVLGRFVKVMSEGEN